MQMMTNIHYLVLGGFVGAPAGVMVPPLNLTRDLGTVVTGLECTGLQNCTNTTMYGDCPNGYATVTCQRGKTIQRSNHFYPLLLKFALIMMMLIMMYSSSINTLDQKVATLTLLVFHSSVLMVPSQGFAMMGLTLQESSTMPVTY